jgi:hypothetical protein
MLCFGVPACMNRTASLLSVLCISVTASHSVPASPPDQRDAYRAVRTFYSYITRHRPLGIPKGRDKKALWPQLSRRLAQQLDTLQLCEDDYFRRNREAPRDSKPIFAWLEYGLFSGGNEAATPSKFSILSAAERNNGMDFHLRFTHKQTYCCGKPPAYEHYEGIVTVISEEHRFVIDDYVPVDDYEPGRRLSPRCRVDRTARGRTLRIQNVR